MRAKTIGAALFAIVVLVGVALAQEMIATPAQATAAKSDAVAGVRPGAPVTPDDSTANDWRYRWFDGRWWYWTPQNRWMWYSDDGHWANFDANQAPLAVDQNNSPPVYQGYYPGGYYYPGPGYYSGYRRGYYYPGVGVGVWPNGDVNVGVGGRVGVDVWGPHGGVRVGRLGVGW